MMSTMRMTWKVAKITNRKKNRSKMVLKAWSIQRKRVQVRKKLKKIMMMRTIKFRITNGKLLVTQIKQQSINAMSLTFNLTLSINWVEDSLDWSLFKIRNPHKVFRKKKDSPLSNSDMMSFPSVLLESWGTLKIKISFLINTSLLWSS